MQDQAEKLKADLIAEMRNDMKVHDGYARGLEKWVVWYGFGFKALAVLATLGGFFVSVEAVRSVITIEPWVISLLVMGSAGFREMGRRMRVKSNIFYERRDIVSQLLDRLVYQMPSPPSTDQLALISREFAQARKRCGEKMKVFNDQEYEPSRGASTVAHNANKPDH